MDHGLTMKQTASPFGGRIVSAGHEGEVPTQGPSCGVAFSFVEGTASQREAETDADGLVNQRHVSAIRHPGGRTRVQGVLPPSPIPYNPLAEGRETSLEASSLSGSWGLVGDDLRL